MATTIEPSLIEKSLHVIIQDIATEEQLAALPYYDGKNTLEDYHHLQLLRAPLLFDQLVGGAEYVDSGDKSCVTRSWTYMRVIWGAAISSNDVMRVGKHYVTFTPTPNLNGRIEGAVYVGIMRQGQADQSAYGLPFERSFFRHFARSMGNEEHHNDDSVQCCMHTSNSGLCYSSKWRDLVQHDFDTKTWDASESTTSSDTIGLLLDYDKETLSVYKNGKNIGVLMRGLTGPYCWVASVMNGAQITIKREIIPPS